MHQLPCGSRAREDYEALKARIEALELKNGANKFRAEIAGKRNIELEAELEDVSGELASIKDFVKSEIRKMPPEYVKGKALDKQEVGDE